MANTLDLVGNYGVAGVGFPEFYPSLFNSTGEPSGNSSKGDSQSVFGELYFQATDTAEIHGRYALQRRHEGGSRLGTVLQFAEHLPHVESSGALNSLLQGCADGRNWQRAALISLGPLCVGGRPGAGAECGCVGRLLWRCGQVQPGAGSGWPTCAIQCDQYAQWRAAGPTTRRATRPIGQPEKIGLAGSDGARRCRLAVRRRPHGVCVLLARLQAGRLQPAAIG